MDEGVIIDCVTQEAQRAPLGAAEQAQRSTDQAEHLTRKRASDEKAARREAVMDKLAAVAEISPDDLKEAFGVRKPGRRL